MYFNEAVNVHGNRNEAILISPAGGHFLVAQSWDFLGYEACITGLEAALDMNVKDFKFYGDSILITTHSKRG